MKCTLSLRSFFYNFSYVPPAPPFDNPAAAFPPSCTASLYPFDLRMSVILCNVYAIKLKFQTDSSSE